MWLQHCGSYTIHIGNNANCCITAELYSSLFAILHCKNYTDAKSQMESDLRLVSVHQFDDNMVVKFWAYLDCHSALCHACRWFKFHDEIFKYLLLNLHIYIKNIWTMIKVWKLGRMITRTVLSCPVLCTTHELFLTGARRIWLLLWLALVFLLFLARTILL